MSIGSEASGNGMNQTKFGIRRLQPTPKSLLCFVGALRSWQTMSRSMVTCRAGGQQPGRDCSSLSQDNRPKGPSTEVSTRYLPNTILTLPDMEIPHTIYLSTLDA